MNYFKRGIGILMISVALIMMPKLSFAENGSAYKVHEQQFFESLDVPLMPGLYEIPEETIVFDKPDGRIIESQAASDHLGSVQIREFYENSLPQMGWIRVSPESFVRQEEILTMEIREQGAYHIVRFLVSPREN